MNIKEEDLPGPIGNKEAIGLFSDNIVTKSVITVTSSQTLTTNKFAATKAKAGLIRTIRRPRSNKPVLVCPHARAAEEAAIQKMVSDAISEGKISHHPAKWAQDSRVMNSFDR